MIDRLPVHYKRDSVQCLETISLFFKLVASTVCCKSTTCLLAITEISSLKPADKWQADKAAVCKYKKVLKIRQN